MRLNKSMWQHWIKYKWHWRTIFGKVKKSNANSCTYWLKRWMMVSNVFSLSFSIIFPGIEKRLWTMVLRKSVWKLTSLHFYTITFVHSFLRNAWEMFDGMFLLRICLFHSLSCSFLLNFLWNWSKITAKNDFPLFVSSNNEIHIGIDVVRFCFIFLSLLFFPCLQWLFRYSNCQVDWCCSIDAMLIQFENRNTAIEKKSGTKWNAIAFNTIIW